jgi:hypothetical protein
MTARQDRLNALAEIYHDAKARQCVDCGVQYPIHVVQLDHRPGVEKLFGVNEPLWRSGSAKAAGGLERAIAELGSAEPAMRAEISKCDVRCSNCHAEVTYVRRQQKYAIKSGATGCLAGEAHCRHGQRRWGEA